MTDTVNATEIPAWPDSIELGSATGASWCWVYTRPRSSAAFAGEMNAARSGPRTDSRCQSPQ